MTTTIHVTGDAYWAYFFTPRDRIFLRGVRADHAHAHSMPVGIEYIYRAIKGTSDPDSLLRGHEPNTIHKVTRGRFPGENDHGN